MRQSRLLDEEDDKKEVLEFQSNFLGPGTLFVILVVCVVIVAGGYVVGRITGLIL